MIESKLRQIVALNTRVDMLALINIGRQIGLKIGLFSIHECWIEYSRSDDRWAAIDNHQGGE